MKRTAGSPLAPGPRSTTKYAMFSARLLLRGRTTENEPRYHQGSTDEPPLSGAPVSSRSAPSTEASLPSSLASNGVAASAIEPASIALESVSPASLASPASSLASLAETSGASTTSGTGAPSGKNNPPSGPNSRQLARGLDPPRQRLARALEGSQAQRTDCAPARTRPLTRTPTERLRSLSGASVSTSTSITVAGATHAAVHSATSAQRMPRLLTMPRSSQSARQTTRASRNSLGDRGFMPAHARTTDLDSDAANPRIGPTAAIEFRLAVTSYNSGNDEGSSQAGVPIGSAHDLPSHLTCRACAARGRCPVQSSCTRYGGVIQSIIESDRANHCVGSR